MRVIELLRSGETGKRAVEAVVPELAIHCPGGAPLQFELKYLFAVTPGDHVH